MGLIRFVSPLQSFLREHGTDCLAVTGAACVVNGVRGFSPALAWIVAGVLLLTAWWRLPD